MPKANKTAIILTALEIETRALLRHLQGWTEETVQGTVFHRGQFEGWEVAIAEIGAGSSPAAAMAERAIQYFKPSIALFVGVAGGVKDVTIGDVVVATKVYGYEPGKEDGSGFKQRPEVLCSAHALEQRGRALRQSVDWKKRLDPAIHHNAPRVFVGPIAAGEKVVASTRGPTASALSKYYGDTLVV